MPSPGLFHQFLTASALQLRIDHRPARLERRMQRRALRAAARRPRREAGPRGRRGGDHGERHMDHRPGETGRLLRSADEKVVTDGKDDGGDGLELGRRRWSEGAASAEKAGNEEMDRKPLKPC